VSCHSCQVLGPMSIRNTTLHCKGHPTVTMKRMCLHPAGNIVRLNYGSLSLSRQPKPYLVWSGSMWQNNLCLWTSASDCCGCLHIATWQEMKQKINLQNKPLHWNSYDQNQLLDCPWRVLNLSYENGLFTNWLCIHVLSLFFFLSVVVLHKLQIKAYINLI